MMKAAKVTSEFYIEHTSLDGIPFWDTGAPQLYKLGDYQKVPSDPFNPYEPVDSSAAAIASQGLLRFGHYLLQNGNQTDGTKYYQAGLTVLCTLLEEPYLGTAEEHEGLLLHSIYHRPNGWDHIPETKTTPCGESSMWGDYHLREAALYALRMAEHKEYLTFFNGMV